MKISNSDLISTIVRRAIIECGSIQYMGLDTSESPIQFFNSPDVHAIKEEIVRTGRKLWERQYVDGNGGNISARISPEYVICTPTLCSKGDLKVEDLSLVDLENRQICGSRPQTSEILLHLEIYKSVPAAKAVIHCHPPYATAHAVAGVIPQGNLVPEQEVFIGSLALASYETPGTTEFARTIRPIVKQHNTILLANHGIVCWADTVTHAEWYAEIVETYCKTIVIASQLRSPLKEIPADKISDLLAIKKRWGLPDARLPEEPEPVTGNLIPRANTATSERAVQDLNGKEIDQLVSSLTVQIVKFFEESA